MIVNILCRLLSKSLFPYNIAPVYRLLEKVENLHSTTKQFWSPALNLHSSLCYIYISKLIYSNEMKIKIYVTKSKILEANFQYQFLFWWTLLTCSFRYHWWIVWKVQILQLCWDCSPEWNICMCPDKLTFWIDLLHSVQMHFSLLWCTFVTCRDKWLFLDAS